jgi:phosphatidate cytidylyltransferase
MLGQRLATAAIGGPLLLALVAIGGVPLVVVAALAAAYGSHELRAMLRRAGYAPSGLVMIPLSAALPLLAWDGWAALEPLVLGLAVVCTLALALARGGRWSAPDWAFTLAGPLLVGGLLRLLVALRLRSDGLWWLLAVVLGTWISDTAAYTTGRLFGRHLLAPAISPKKTVEGLVGSLVATPLALALLVLLAPGVGVRSPMSVPAALGAGLLLALAATLGDLAESLIKRQCGVKDSGAVFPGHGGLLDRVDSLLFAGLAGYGVALVVR